MHLVVHVPYGATEESERALSLARRAPSFTVERVENRRMAVAIFPSLPACIDLAVELVGEAVRLPDAWASMNAVRVSTMTKLWQRLTCYRDSLGASDVRRYCLEKSAHFHALVGCEGQECPVSCQFICRPCLHTREDEGAVRAPESYAAAAIQAEIDWCPRLALPPATSQLISLSRNLPR